MLTEFFISVSKENNLADFKPPYKVIGKIDKELFKERYLSLHNYSHGVYQRHFKW